MKHLFSVAILPIVLGGCAATPPAEVTTPRDPSDVAATITLSRFHSPVSGYAHRMPVDPKPWRKLNEDVSPDGGDAS
ncbi:hypothetical protein JJB09_24820 [Rhizobium sp. KVB221]|uniref:Lipoprotein n=1 Tax=Rhizobium setariae TaxID=2801340 RepID=A0A936YUF3_9HYPH|nr:hypothetical protein [Rhizobium setariae]MBL0375242.1 hypothetical protein [Rhizobium setariae]